MKTVLIVEDEEKALQELVDELERHSEGFQFLTSADGREILDIVHSQEVDMLVIDPNMSTLDGFELLAHIQKHHREIPVVAMVDPDLPKAQDLVRQWGGLQHHVSKPVDFQELVRKILSILASRSRAYIHGFSLATFLQAVEMEQKSCALWVSSKGREGFLHLKEGVLVDADTDRLRGEKAAIEIFCWDDAEIKILDVYKKKQVIHTPLKSVLFNAFRLKDERSHETDAAQESYLEKAITLAEAHHFGEAQTLLTTLLKKAPRNPRAWLWYSRLFVNMDSVERSLSNAARLAPKDEEIIGEINKFHLAKKKNYTGQLRRCPFCWFPVPEKEPFCEFCRACVFINDSFFKAERDADMEIMNRGIERYTRVIRRESNATAHFYLALAHLNLGNWEQALGRLHKAVKLAPKNQFFTGQLDLLMTHMAAAEELPSRIPEPITIVPSSQAGESKLILVVEDSPITRKVIAITLAENGYRVMEAEDGLDALSKMSDQVPDLILLDIILPKMDGYQLLTFVRNSPEFKHIPVIMLTSKDRLRDKVRAKLAGSTKYLTKPFKPNELLQTIRKYTS